ncbi:HindIII family type II restriction endonuclease [Rhodococcus sp. IEGM 1401]|uniref:HindIII family type II restriction endonuclease n=1 Tax=unclassified Rhodococcus (in: high G+C Gram-positive bacteria) TaxID=192944 RepID=UPI0022B418FA|nr:MULTISPECIES: HindIII family type II restriction endonuclease [unclassified Rhodococcus (in: high G+C Gram-positive bacteria)]MCZ4563551.1 HindIII family type II restriction endonuclease [Rhodococcus sp. IEGM 1401]MDI9923693.1 HindIII family type II restriction endonuclease [Rhodococcus sp. IEGM 1372]MDV8036166.1 HindIII family type II restriction endonuclease [Rhodococcus sp. IEGM 1414]
MVTPELVEITPNDLLVRANWIQTMQSRTGLFLDSTAAAEAALEAEIAQNGASPLLAHLRLCGTIPESFGHDSSEEKLYSKYTDAVLCETFRFLGMRSLVLAGRADCADVEAFSSDHSFDLVADAKVFRLSRTAKNAKDFKVASMNRWKYGKKYATVVCPIYQLPTSNSQIYEQAIALDVCILSYSHLATLVTYKNLGLGSPEEVLQSVLDVTTYANPSKSSVDYWTAINRAFIEFDRANMAELWAREKRANVEAIACAKVEALTHLAAERSRIMNLSHDEAVKMLITMRKIDSREAYIKSVTDNLLLSR